MNTQLVLNELAQLPVVLQKEALDFIEFLQHKHGVKKQTKRKRAKKPVFGCLKGSFIMTKDFDAPLEDFKEYMQ